MKKQPQPPTYPTPADVLAYNPMSQPTWVQTLVNEKRDEVLNRK